MNILNNKGPKIDPCGTISRSTNYICHLFLLFVFCLRFNYVLILNNYCQNHTYLPKQLKAHEADNRKPSIDQ